MEIEFIGHAGFSVRSGGLQVLIDPWFSPSTQEKPILKSMVPGHSTIDYLIPEPRASLEDFDPDIILISHYHTHHSSQQDIEFWLTRSKKSVTLIGYKFNSKVANDFQNYFAEKFQQHRFLTCDQDEGFNFEHLEIRCLTNSARDHLSFFVKENGVSFLHIADAPISRIPFDRRLDTIWHKYSSLQPTFMVLSVGAISTRKTDKSGNPFILENSFLSPVEAANLVRAIKPKWAGVMGVFNFSIWKNRTEFGFSPYDCEAYFRWAVEHLEPTINVPNLRPGNIFQMTGQDEVSIRFRPRSLVPIA